MKQGVERTYLPEFVYGGIDGAITTFAVVAGALGASLSSSIILILGSANLVADGFSMAVANYLSVKSSREINGTKQKTNEMKHPLKAALATYAAFIVLGLIPLLPFILSGGFYYSIIATAIAFLIIGAVKGLVVKKHWIRSALETLIIGGIAAALAFAAGYWIEGIVSG